MTEFNYDSFPVELLEAERERINDQIADREHRRSLIETAIGRKAVQASYDSEGDYFDRESLKGGI